MGKHDKKTGKGRLDKFYRLAKEQGYRARSAFKLVHLNRKYDLLSKSKCVIDLCAAPGGWLQVAEKYMPKGSLIIGVDLNPIKPLPHVTTFVSDITTPHCRQMLKQHMHDWKADLVMHDGAPNVGSAWVQDAFTQNELVLQSLKLATEFLVKGGHFVTKVFRSQDYNSLMWVFGQLFKSVEATKPPSSRNVSAEIFVVCRDFLAPKHIDPKFLDPKHVFKDLAPLPTSITTAPTESSTTGEASIAATQASTSTAAAAAARLAANSHAHSNVFAPEKKRRHRDGYAEGDYTLFHTASATDFIKGMDPVLLLGGMNKITFDTEEEKQWLKSRHTTPDIVANCNDLKVLGKGDFKALMKWRLAIRLEIGLDVKADPTADATEEVAIEPIDEEEQITEDLKRLQETKSAKTKRERKRANEKKAKDLLKLQLNMTAPEDLDTNDLALKGEEEIFDLEEGEMEAKRQGSSSKRSLRDIVQDADGMDESEGSESESDEEDEEILDSDEEREMKTAMLEGELDGLYETYKERMQERDAKWKVKNERNKDKNFDAWHGIKENSDEEGGDDNDEEREEDDEDEEGGWDLLQNKKADDQDSDTDSDSDADQDMDENDEEVIPRKAKKEKVKKNVIFEQPQSRRNTSLVTSLQEPEKRAQMSRQAQLWFDQSVFKGMDDLAALDGDEEEEEAEEDEDEEPTEDEIEENDEDEDEDDEDDFEIVPQEEEDDGTGWDVDDEDQDEVKKKIIKDKGLLTAEAVTLATSLVNREITASQLIDQGFNKLSTFNKDGLPSWFLDDESKFYKPNIPITKEAVEALKARQRALDARPIKKVAEAKQRKKFKAVQRMEKAKKKADDVMGSEEMGDGEKARQVRRMLAKAARGKQKAAEKKIVVAKGVNRGVKGRPKGVKGKYKIVDSRMRKEVRAMKRIKKANKKR
uniref:AdoMet-dependent rRNA methyltransferase SPB1 n=1 Tax=Kwoniella dejecticola CBS 10117 TaxID=1296121 RepID=A0A1A6A7H6_9TREE|nr:AdoMet-dependent rRNA methyltransferase SPB1 [Kwoniella dejecticola CBS 10117]OBR86010.1 AdoMet-dependent rRNA methyltransferase SPB1 [Kwoniella dejecticola CBS 10117]